MLRRSCFSLKYLSTPLALTPLPPPSTRAVAKQGLGTPLVTARPAHGGKASSRHNSPILTIRHMHAWTHPPTQLCLSRPTFDDKTRPACGKKAAAGARKENCAPVIVPTTQTWTNLSETSIFFWTNNKSQLSLLLKYSLCLWTKNVDIKWKLLRKTTKKKNQKLHQGTSFKNSQLVYRIKFS